MSYLTVFSLLETFPGWPESPSYGIADIGMLLLGWPLVIAAVFTLAIMGPYWLRKSQGKEIERT